MKNMSDCTRGRLLLYSLYLILHVISPLGHHPRGAIKSPMRFFLVLCWLRADELLFLFFLLPLFLPPSVACGFAEERPRRCTDWWEGMIYVAPVSQLSSGPLSLITAIRLPLHHCSPCLRPAVTASLLSHIHKGKGRLLSPQRALQKHRDAGRADSMCSGGMKSYNSCHYATEGGLLPLQQRCPTPAFIPQLSNQTSVVYFCSFSLKKKKISVIVWILSAHIIALLSLPANQQSELLSPLQLGPHIVKHPHLPSPPPSPPCHQTQEVWYDNMCELKCESNSYHFPRALNVWFA